MTKKHLLILAVLFLIVISILFYLNSVGENKMIREKTIKTAEDFNKIDFKEIVDFNWDTMYVFNPYSNAKDILKKDGVSTYKSKFNIEYSDSVIMIAFVSENKLVTYIELPRNYVQINSEHFLNFNVNEAEFDVINKQIVF
ncbi:MAG: hypothetical protein PHD15_07200 [Clostridia bacterium]|nr:hypothetical protein [Clostridia bacterium]